MKEFRQSLPCLCVCVWKARIEYFINDLLWPTTIWKINTNNTRREKQLGKEKSVHPRPLPQHNEEEVVSDPEDDNSSLYINTDNDNLIDD